jgi:hypothetical protein
VVASKIRLRAYLRLPETVGGEVMTKDGRPSRIHDIRYFWCEEKSFTPVRSFSYLEGHDDAVAFGRHMAWFLNGEGFSCGAYPALYIQLTPTLRPGVIQITDEGGEWWKRYTYVGVPEGFPNVADSSEVVKSGTVAALKAIRPDLASVVENAEKIVRAHGDNLRFLIKTRQTKRYIVDLSCNIPVWKQPSYIFTSLTDLSSGAFLEAPPLLIEAYLYAFDYNGPIRVTDIDKELSDFVPKTRPVMSKMVKRCG